jgi:hypothetical protein
MGRMTDKPKRTRRNAGKEVAPVKEPTERMKRAYSKGEATYAALPHRPRVKVENTSAGTVALGFETKQECRLMGAAFGSSSSDVLDRRLLQLVSLSMQGSEAKGKEVNEAMAFVAAVAPRDEVEAAMAVQLYGAQQMAYEMMARAKRAEMLPQLQAYANLAVKFQRTFGTLFETLERSRRGGEQVVRHIHVDNRGGGQAIVADTVNYGGAGNGKSDGQPYEAGNAAMLSGRAALLGENPLGDGMSVSGDAERPLPTTRWEESGRTEGQP